MRQHRDAASRTGVDDMRDLLESAVYKPANANYKIYLIDEVHMLSKSSFNALLKTLEEPPPHMIFLMATTELEKVPKTVLSRCLQLNLKAVATALRLSCKHRESTVLGTFSSSVVAIKKIICGGGSSKVFNSALKELFDSMCTSSMR